MNWFQRYGIPGAYFIGLTIAWMNALSDMELKDPASNILIILAAITFIPIGYIISIFQQWLYYIIPFLGIHREAKNDSGLELPGDPNDEPTVEAYSIIQVLKEEKEIDRRVYVQDWIRRRMDVIAINFSLIIATILSFIIALLITKLYLQSNPQCPKVVFLTLVCFSVVFVLVSSKIVLRGQIRKVITEDYKIITYGKNMRTLGVFIDTCTVNRMLDIDVRNDSDQCAVDREYLSKLVSQYVGSTGLRLIVNPTVREEIKKTKDAQRKRRLLNQYNEYAFTSFNKSIFPFTFPATFLQYNEKKIINELFQEIPNFKKEDVKIFADAVYNSKIDVLLTTDREHLANDKLREFIRNKGLDKKIKVFTPKELFEYLLGTT